MPSKTTVLVVDDETAILNLMRDFLEVENFAVELAQDGRTALEILRNQTAACVLLDIMLPDVSGFELCRQLREVYDVPVLFLSALGSDMDKIRGLGLGGDDYIVKSATPLEVVARVKAVLRRTRPLAPVINLPQSSLLDFGRLVINLKAHEVKVDKRQVRLAAS